MDNNKKINAIVVDDEEGGIKFLEYNLTRFCPKINVVGSGQTLTKALAKAGDEKVDLAFLDIELFNENIFDALENIESFDFKIVFVTAYEKYAIKAFKVNAIDYIVKPLAEEDIKKCYARILDHFLLHPEELHDAGPRNENAATKKIILKDADKIYIIKNDDIYYLSGNGFYTTVTFLFNGEEKSVILSKPLNKIENEYNCNFFFRVHKSYVINTNKISAIQRHDGITLKMQNDKEITVAKRRSNDFLAFINR
jgi:two-component system LytT family response regulator